MQYSVVLALVLWYLKRTAAVAVMCNPLKEEYCDPNPALGTTLWETFKTESPYFVNYTNTGLVEYNTDGVAFTMAKRFDNPAIMSDFYIMYGKVEVQMKAAEGRGIVSSFYLQSDTQDEIDIEWLGGERGQFQSNFFYKGDTTTYVRGQFHNVALPQHMFHTYTIDWRMESTTWYLDGKPVRTLLNNTEHGYPQTPMRVFMGIWAGGDPSNEPGTIQWAGGETNYAELPFTAYIKKVIVSDYSTGNTYSYSDKSGSWTSIESDGGELNDRLESAIAEFQESQLLHPEDSMIYSAPAKKKKKGKKKGKKNGKKKGKKKVKKARKNMRNPSLGPIDSPSNSTYPPNKAVKPKLPTTTNTNPRKSLIIDPQKSFDGPAVSLFEAQIQHTVLKADNKQAAKSRNDGSRKELAWTAMLFLGLLAMV
ncbi:HGL184Wp [Eremothecium sinecaudum]|uniref:HGL184Wp n=1 Tax=Eremothecium sinecaudum TaxID=45286 RepID=A0A109UY15_9SACH|nr:HGL184Wp [Eremothecium sinecaudum]AMD22156.1 HGL184Wp [Eremothecium sinecaudum]